MRERGEKTLNVNLISIPEYEMKYYPISHWLVIFIQTLSKYESLADVPTSKPLQIKKDRERGQMQSHT